MEYPLSLVARASPGDRSIIRARAQVAAPRLHGQVRVVMVGVLRFDGNY